MDRKRAILLAVKERRLSLIEAKEALQQLLREERQTSLSAVPATETTVADSRSIAIIGISGRFPDAKNVEELWANLAQGKSSVKDAPLDRGWNVADYYDPRPQTPGRTYATQGAYLADVAQFDAKFFGISPREAERMDPSERLFLQESWRAIENAGYSPNEIAGQKWGVFACAKGDYATHIQQQDPTFHFSTDSIAASRLSYLLNLIGPAVTVDTACSSTLAAIAYACDSLSLGNCDVAIAGGGGIYTTPNMLVTASQASLFSPTGRTFTFDSRADGIVLGEVIGSVVLKPLARAIADRDPIWALIKGWGTNQDGRTNGITAPNANAQARLQTDIYRKFDIDPRGITMVEAHGTGTRLGDPIEVQALTESFRTFTQDSAYCALSSIKPNIGHAFFGAGVAGVIKVLLSLRQRQIPPNINFEKPNPHLQLEGTPFVIHTALKPWAVDAGAPRRAAVSSFGATGINVHLVLEEFLGVAPRPAKRDEVSVIPLSARTPELLHESVGELKHFLAALLVRQDSSVSLRNIAYTLQVARQPRAARLAIVARSIEELIETLERYLQGAVDSSRVFVGERKDTGSGLHPAEIDSRAAANGTLLEAAKDWAGGRNVDWRGFYQSADPFEAPSRVHLPGTAFAQDRHWIGSPTAIPASKAHPLLQRQVADAARRHFVSHFTGEEFFLAAHRVQRNRVLPGVAYLEMVRAAIEAGIESGDERRAILVNNIVWIQPYVYSAETSELHIELTPEGSAFQFRIYSGDAGTTVHCQGVVSLAQAAKAPQLDLAQIRHGVTETRLVASDCYARFASLGFELGPKLQGLKQILRGPNQVLARLELPQAIQSSQDASERDFGLHPALMDSALQACIGFSIAAESGYSFAMDKPALPFVLERLEIFNACAPRLWVWIRAHEDNLPDERVHRFDMDLCDEAGKVCVRMRGFSSSELKRGIAHSSARTPARVGSLSNERDVALFEPVWMECPAKRVTLDIERHLVLLDVPAIDSKALERAHCRGTVSAMDSEEREADARFISFSAQVFALTKRIAAASSHQGAHLQVIAPLQSPTIGLNGISALLRAATLEHSGLSTQLILIDTAMSSEALARAIDEHPLLPSETLVRYQQGVREALTWRELPATRRGSESPWKDGGTYLITGGLGFLGRQFATEILRKTRDARLVLTGRSALSAAQQSELDALNRLGGQVVYRRVDVCDRAATQELIAESVASFGALRGVIHCAGSIVGTLFAQKTAGELERIMRPRVTGVVNLDLACADSSLDFFVLFSSSAGVLGAVRQPDYAAGHAFMDEFAAYRNQLVTTGQRRGRTLSLSWPAWSAGALPIDAEDRALLEHNIGLAPLQATQGMDLFYAALESGADHVMAVSGDLKLIRRTVGQSWLGVGDEKAKAPPAAPPASERKRSSDEEVLREGVHRALIEAIARVNKLAVADIDVDVDFGDLGFDSISLTSLGDVLNREYGLNLLPTLFFEYPTVSKCAAHLLGEHAAVFRSAWGLDESTLPKVEAQTPRVAAPAAQAVAPLKVAPAGVPVGRASEPIAIVGMSGCFPKARTISELWDNLAASRDCISEVPESRWDWREIYGDPQTHPDKTHIKWGGFIDGVDEFDPLFFNIPPRDAELLDPQHRLLMTHVWSAIEDAGYAPSSLAGTNTAIYVGTAADMGYGDLVSRATGRDYAPPPVSMAPNRMSYLLDLRGPSEPIETACSSSLVAIHRGVVAMRAGLCDAAIVGGVQTMVTPAKHISFSRSGLLCEDGRCKAFSARANGFVRGEGVGMLMLKRLSDAEAAGDHIYAVILATSENHGGRANSFTSPNPLAQAELLKAAYRQSGIDPTSVSYIEAHGTGTELGDPIEINGLKLAFKELLDEAGRPGAQSFCGLGSIKSNIGHLEIAAGVAGVIKVLLQMRHRTLVQSLHTEQINPYIQLDGSPFYIVQQKRPWAPASDGAGRALPRRAGVSSFGIGGANAHVVLQEYVPSQHASVAAVAPEPTLILLSAKSPERLKAAATELLAFLRKERPAETQLRNIAYTLQVGRDAMEERLGILVRSLAELETQLQAYLDAAEATAKELPADMRQGQARRQKSLLKGFEGDAELAEMVEKWLERRKLSKLLDLWVSGLSIDWSRLYASSRPTRMSLPTYPFERERHWVTAPSQYIPAPRADQARIERFLHPLVHRNTSSLSEQRFSSVFSGEEFFFADHVVRQTKLLPGVAYLEMARAAVAQALDGFAENDQTLRVCNVAWVRPIALDDGERTVHIRLENAERADQVSFEIYSDSIIHCHGMVEIAPRAVAVPVLNLAELRETLPKTMSGLELYALFGSMGIDYGPGHKGVIAIHVGKEQALGELRVPESVRAQWREYALHPGLLDSALQVSLALSLDSDYAAAVGSVTKSPVLPFALDRLEQHAPCTEHMWARVKLSNAALSKVDVELCDEGGNLCVRIIGLTSRILPDEAGLLATPVWQDASDTFVDDTSEFSDRHVLLLDRQDSEARDVEQRLPQCSSVALRSAEKSGARFVDFATQTIQAVQAILKSPRKAAPSGGKTLLQLVVCSGQSDASLEPLFAVLRTLNLENPNYIGQLIALPQACQGKALSERLEHEARHAHDEQVRYIKGTRQKLVWQEVRDSSPAAIPWKNSGTYLITGGVGGLGRVLAREILAQTEGCNIVLVGRSPVEKLQESLQALRLAAKSAVIDYRQADVGDAESVGKLCADVAAQYGSIQGIIHAAGVLRDSFLIKKSAAEVQEVLAPKVTGTEFLDEATREWDLDFFVLFSSAAGALGNSGQADYAVANAFLDEFARRRNALVEVGQRSGHTLSVNWPLWEDGGMSISVIAAEEAKKRFGMTAMSTSQGLRVLYFALQARVSQLLALAGDASRLRALLGGAVEANAARGIEPEHEHEALPVVEREAATLKTQSSEDLSESARGFFAKLLSTTLKIPAQKIRADEPFEQYGIDSIVVMDLTRRLEEHFGSLPKTLFFEYQNIDEITRYFMREHAQRMQEILTPTAPRPATVEGPERPMVQMPVRSRLKRPAAVPDRGVAAAQNKPLDIAIVGLSGRYPQAIDLEAFWENLRDGRNCIAEVPQDRWDWRKHYDPQKQRLGGHYSKWGGFISGMDEFDPLFFNISPREAEYMDPQERLFLMHAWSALEDAGYTRAALKAFSAQSSESSLGAAVGVYAGVMYVEYQLYGAEQTLLGNPVSLSGSAASISNRVSYILGLHGPSLTVDTMCSSSLTAIHLACQDLKAGRTALAIAGGVNLTIHANKYSMLSGGQFISTAGQCESFGAGGDGYIPGEGVGVVILKRLEDAERANDHIYAVIKGSSINHGGRTNGYSVPNPAAQQLAIHEALREAQLDPRCVSYVEAHGTGTKLGDPIEIAGLTHAFRSRSEQITPEAGQFCWIGSAKSNIGHCESAAGIAGLTKVLLQMRHRMLAPSLHAEVLNPHIDFEATPFAVNRELREWQRPELTDAAGVRRVYPRIAGVSSFGAGGSNAHLLIEEYEASASTEAESTCGPHIVPLSAKTPESLRDYVQKLLAFVDSNLRTLSLRDACYTLQVGREAMPVRLALIVSTTSELRGKLQEYLSDPSAVEDLFQGEVSEGGRALSSLSDDSDLRDTLRIWIEKKKYARLAELWVNGSNLDWALFHQGQQPKRVSLPTYAFAKERYWIPNEVWASPAIGSTQLHPLLHRNTSELGKQQFTSTFTGEEFFLADHVIGSEKILPGVAYLEMARAGLQKSCGLEPDQSVPVIIEHCAWAQPLAVGSPRDVNLAMYADDQARVRFEITSAGKLDAALRMHAQGAIRLPDLLTPATLDVSAIRTEMRDHRIEGPACYERFEAAGLHYGSQHRCLNELYIGRDQVLAHLRLSAASARDHERYVMHPGLLDSALQACIGFDLQSKRVYLPFAVEQVEIHRACADEMWAWARIEKGVNDAQRKVDIDLCDAQGVICVRIKGLTSRAAQSDASASSVILAAPRWVHAPVPDPTDDVEAAGEHWILCCGMQEGVAGRLQSLIPGARCVEIASLDASGATFYAEQAVRVFEQAKSIVSNLSATSKARLQLVIPNDARGALLQGLSGLLRSVELETARVLGQTLSVARDIDAATLAELLGANAGGANHRQVRWVDGTRFVSSWEELAIAESEGGAPWRDGGVYLITGGVGGLGRIFARDILSTAQGATVVLSGRSALNESSRPVVSELAALGRSRANQVHYLPADNSDAAATVALIETIVDRYGALRGVLHCAGTNEGSFLIRKSSDGFRRVLAPKVAGAENLDRATERLQLDFFVLFSSTTGVTGAIGQADYAAANGFLDQFANHRNELVAKGCRSGHTLSIDWPLWAEGGMQVDADTVEQMERLLGLVPLRTDAGIQAFHAALATKRTQVLVQAGAASRIRSVLFARQAIGSSPQQPAMGPRLADARPTEVAVAIEALAIELVTAALSRALRMPAGRIDRHTALEHYGLESKLVLGMTNELEKIFGPLSKTLFFEYRNVTEVSRYFAENHRQSLLALAAGRRPAAVESRPGSSPRSIAVPMMSAAHSSSATTPLAASIIPTVASVPAAHSQAPTIPLVASSVSTALSAPIAIIGLSGRYPKSNSLEEYWRNLREGRDCIEEIPADRWSWRRYYSAAGSQSVGKWGGFIEGVDQFDPLFFNISPHEARYLDPQERLFLEHAWIALEDAGYTREALGQQRVGVYAGVMYSEYQLYGVEETARGNPIGFASSLASVANRVSYVLNLDGPSVALDTMCSSSLTALHVACQDLRLGQSSMAIAGGVNVSVHPNKYLALSSGRFLSSRGRCVSFGVDGDGYVPGEGVGVAILKRLADAEADGDLIYGVIRSSAINHGGKTNGYSVPNPKAQESAIVMALEKAQIDPRAISYVEAHGTGTKLGDPIEITALTRAFRATSEKASSGLNVASPASCWIGSVKSNIGHCEAAAGIAGLTKILLQMRHGEIAPSLHSRTTNPFIDFASTPFTVNQELREWPRSELTDASGVSRPVPRIAGLSSFGAGGSNAHLIVEEYVAPTPSAIERYTGPYLALLSAKTPEALRAYVQRLLTFVETSAAPALRDLCYTLQVGRESMPERVALIVHSVEDLREKLRAFLRDPNEVSETYRGRATDSQSLFDATDEGFRSAIATWIATGRHGKLLEFWVRGLAIDWSELYSLDLERPRRIRLPTYPFAKERHWITSTAAEGALTRGAPDAAVIHPLLHRNTSDFFTQRFSATFSGQESFLCDHRVRMDGTDPVRVLPAAVYLEMTRAAIQSASALAPGDFASLRLHDIVWQHPFSVADEPKSLHLSLSCDELGRITYEFQGDAPLDSAKPLVYAKGCGELAALDGAASSSLTDLQRAITERTILADECYERFDQLGIALGAAHRAIVEMHLGDGQVLARLELPPHLTAAECGGFVLHPSLLDAALQATVGLTWQANESGRAQGGGAIPHALDEIEILQPVKQEAWAWVRAQEASKAGLTQLDIDIFGASGELCVRLKGLTSRPTPMPVVQITAPRWEVIGERGDSDAPTARQIILCEMPEVDVAELQSALSDATCVSWTSEWREIGDRFSAYASDLLKLIQSLSRSKSADGTLRADVGLQLVASQSADGELLSALAAMLRSARLESSTFHAQLVQCHLPAGARELREQLNAAWRDRDEVWIRWERGQRLIRVWKPLATQVGAPTMPWKHRGVYLLTGGLGGLGRIFAEEILSQVEDATLIITGRSDLDSTRQQTLADLRALGRARAVVYKPVDVSSRSTVEALIREIVAEFGSLSGILHGAGVLADGLLTKQSESQLRAALAPKVAGARHLDDATRDLTLDFFVLFSSATAVWGGLGQSGYAVANAFMDQFAHWRNRLRAAGERSGRTLSINWPYWKDGGMRLTADLLAKMQSVTGAMALGREAGLQCFYRALASGESQVMVDVGNIERIARFRSKQNESHVPLPRAQSPRGGDLAGVAIEVLKGVLSQILSLPAERIREDEAFESYGINSVMVIDLTSRLEALFGSLSKTLLYEYQTLSELARHFVKYHAETLASLSGVASAPVIEPEPARRPARLARLKSDRSGSALDIAIIGLSGRYPQADDLTQFWEVLRRGTDCITPVPAARWRSEDEAAPQWGGFISGVDEFDPLFFRISPRDADYMDPQERLFLQHAWMALEDAGYTRAALQDRTGGKVGVYAGVMSSEYHLLVLDGGTAEKPAAASASHASIANRVSYALNLMGPSMTVDTMCSSSLTCVHLACQDLRLGRTHLGIAGGVNVNIHPNKYAVLGASGFLSRSGRCESFGDGGDGYVPSEGVGVALLKRLEDAVQDGDAIYGVIKGSALNHGGKTNGYTVPNPNAQRAVIDEALSQAGVHPRTITYLEAHGTGTKLGDPIEITGLSKAFAAANEGERPVCWVGSVKSNIGHCESAAGIAALSKVLLQMRAGQIAPSLHSARLNPNIDFGSTAFAVNQTLRSWERPTEQTSNGRVKLPLRAGVSSFGAGGSNAHLIIEEYRERDTSRRAPSAPVLVPISAQNEDRLKDYATRLIAFLDRVRAADEALDIADLAYTLQIGREAMPARFGARAHSLEELSNQLRAFLAGEKSEAQSDLLEAWLRGESVDWSSLYAEGVDAQQRPRRIHVPTYPFAKDRHWVSKAEPAADKTRRVVLTKSWVECVRQKRSVAASGLTIMLHGAGARSLADLLARGRQNVELVSSGDTDFYAAEAGKQAARRILDQHAQRRLVALIDLTALDEDYERSSEVESGKIALLQSLIEARREDGFTLLQVTPSLLSFKAQRHTLQGARSVGLYRMLGAEHRALRCLTLDSDTSRDDELVAQIESELGVDGRYSEVCYRASTRCEPKWVETALPVGPRSAHEYSASDVVLITGGSRGIGAEIAKHVVARGARRLVIVGRERLPAKSTWPSLVHLEKVHRLQTLVEKGVKVLYFNTPLSDRAALERMVGEIHCELGSITSVFHCAGASGKSPAFYRKSAEEFVNVYAPKVTGLLGLQDALDQEPVKHWVLFSSVASATPLLAAGQSDYAAANAFMDCFAEYQRSRGRQGFKSLQWPQWADVGMASGLAVSAAYRSLGLETLRAHEALQLLDEVLASPHTVCAPAIVRQKAFAAARWAGLESQRESIRAQTVDAGGGIEPTVVAARHAGAETVAVASAGACAAAGDWLTELFVSELRLKASQVDQDKSFDEYGVESIVVAQLVRAISDRVGAPLDPSILFEHNTLRKLAGYLAADFEKAFAIEAPLAKQAQDAALASRESATVAPSRIPGVSAPSREDIAVVGLSCRLPGAPNYTAYWNLLRNGATAIARGPQGRWESDAKYFGGWLEDIDAFDASFFNLKDSDARVLDPQTRLLLEESLSAIYDAGYEHPKLAGRKIGVYIGARSQGAADPEAIAAAANPVLGLAPNYVATSISRFFDFRGPSSVVDTACSSAITGLSFAADALLAGRIEMALIGAVNLLPTPAAHEMFNARGLLSPSGEVRLFDRRADGEVLGEGGGVVIVKRLSDAIRDGNRIYAVVKSIALNNDGRTLGPGSPNVHAQRELLTEALAASGRRMEDVGYIEVSGNGSPVVDAVELRALTDIYKLKERALGTCYLGSIKPNIGHLLLGSGLAAFVRCVLSVHRREIPPFLAAREPFEFYDFSASRIEFNRETISWALNDERPARVAALSSFPDGGTNGHVIIEEFTSGESHVQRLHAIQPPTLKRKPLRESAPARAPERDLFPESAAALTLDLAETLSRFARSRTPASLPEELDFYW